MWRPFAQRQRRRRCHGAGSSRPAPIQKMVAENRYEVTKVQTSRSYKYFRRRYEDSGASRLKPVWSPHSSAFLTPQKRPLCFLPPIQPSARLGVQFKIPGKGRMFSHTCPRRQVRDAPERAWAVTSHLTELNGSPEWRLGNVQERTRCLRRNVTILARNSSISSFTFFYPSPHPSCRVCMPREMSLGALQSS